MEGPELMAYDAQDDMDDTPSEAAGIMKKENIHFDPSRTDKISMCV